MIKFIKKNKNDPWSYLGDSDNKLSLVQQNLVLSEGWLVVVELT